jgi:hypothetical protein
MYIEYFIYLIIANRPVNPIMKVGILLGSPKPVSINIDQWEGRGDYNTYI